MTNLIEQAHTLYRQLRRMDDKRADRLALLAWRRLARREYRAGRDVGPMWNAIFAEVQTRK